MAPRAAFPGEAERERPACPPIAVAPLNANLDLITLPSDAWTTLVRMALVGDSQSIMSSRRLPGGMRQWNMPYAGWLATFVSNAGIAQSAVSGKVYGAQIDSHVIPLGGDHGDGNTGSHFGFSRRWAISGSIMPDGSELGRLALNGEGFAAGFDLDARLCARVAAYDMAGGFSRFRIAAQRGGAVGDEVDLGTVRDAPPALNEDGVLRWWPVAIPAAGELGARGDRPAGIVVRDSDGLDANRTLTLAGALLHLSPHGTALPEAGLMLSVIAQSSWTAYRHLTILSQDAIDAVISMNEGLDLLTIMLGHNSEENFHPVTNPDAYALNVQALAERFRTRHVALGFDPPDVLVIAPWPVADASINERLRTQTENLHALALSEGYGFISLFDYFGGGYPQGIQETPRGTFTYTMDGSHPADAPTATTLALDIAWHFEPAHWIDPRMPLPTLAPCDLDLDGDCRTDFTDLVVLLSAWGPCSACPADLDRDGQVGFSDLIILLSAWGPCGSR